MRKLLFLFLFAFSTIVSKQALASHYAGGELLYQWVSGNTFKFTLIIYRDCNGISLNAGPESICAVNTCTGTTATFTIPMVSGGIGGTVISTGCPLSTPATCTGFYTMPNGVIVPIYGKTVYEGNYTLSGLCNDWRFFYDGNARNAAITNLTGAGSSSLHVEARLNNIDAPTGSSPNFIKLPSAYTCNNVGAALEFECTDVDADSLVYTSIKPREQGLGTCALGVNMTYVSAPTYDENNPFPCSNSFNCVPSNGYVTFTPSQIGVVVITVLVDQYKNGIWVGSIIRDIQIVIRDCPSSPSTTYLPGGTVQFTNNKLVACVGDTLAYCKIITSLDTSGSSVLSVTPSYPLPLGMLPPQIDTVSITGYDSVRVCMVWIPQPGQTGWVSWKVNIVDSGCNSSFPVILQQTSIDSIYIIPPTIGTVDTVICANVPVQLGIAQGAGTAFTWNLISGSASPTSPFPCSFFPCTTTTNAYPQVNVGNQTTQFTVQSIMADTTGCPSIDTVTITVAQTPYVNCGPDVTICPNATFHMNPTINGQAGQAYSYSWSPTTFLSNPNIPDPDVINPTATTTYTLTVTPVGAAPCSNIDIIKVNVVGGFNITSSRDTTICDGNSVVVQGTGSAAYTYTWIPSTGVSNPNILTPTITPAVTAPDSVVYTVYAQYPTCPDSVQTVTVHIDPNPIVHVSNDTLICYQDTANLIGMVTPAAPNYIYEWSPGANVLEPHDLQTFYAGNNGGNTELLYLFVSTPIGCFGYDSMVINIDPAHFLTSLNDTSICPLDTVTYTVNGAVQYQWSPAMWLDLPTSNSIKVFPTASTTYTIVGINNHGCYDSAKYNVFVMPNANVELGPNQTLYPGDSVYLNPSGNLSTFNWSPPYALSSTTSSNPYAKPDVTTRYVVTGSTELGCMGSDSIDIIVLDETLFEIPNAFSPGTGTSSNDYLQIIKRGNGTLNSFKVFNRWGELVYSTTDIDAKWDGTSKGKYLPIGVYQYMLDATTNKGKRISKSGNITLIR